MADAVLLGSAGVAAIAVAAVAWAIARRGERRRIDTPEEAARAAEEAVPGFVTRDAVVGADSRAALVVGEGARAVVVTVRGARLAARPVEWRTIRAVADGMLVETGDRRFGAVLLARVDALDMRRLSRERVAG